MIRDQYFRVVLTGKTAKQQREEKDKQANVLVLQDVFFDFDRSVVKPEGEAELQKAVDFLNERPELSFEISGHTDAVGSHDYNQPLSERRAKAVKSWLIGKGIAERRLVAKGYGKSKPLARSIPPSQAEPQVLEPDEETQFQAWYKLVARYKELGPDPDDMGQYYDYRGFWKHEPVEREKMLRDDREAHFIDRYKLPGHPTFSTESKYSAGETIGGTWTQVGGQVALQPFGIYGIVCRQDPRLFAGIWRGAPVPR